MESIERAAEAIAGAKALLVAAGAGMGGRSFVFTSNADGQFQRAGFPDDSIVECHGSIHHLQCLGDCGVGLFRAEAAVDVDPATFRARPPLPNVLM